nr:MULTISPECIES: H-NS histone family protein [Bradyrhizobium]
MAAVRERRPHIDAAHDSGSNAARPAAAEDPSNRQTRSSQPLAHVCTPRYRNPKNSAETWSWRGKLPRWLSAQLRAGRKLADFLADQSPARRRRRNA